ncbi:MAG: hypothetical protein ACLTSG_09910 [Lachnospiraceae bacterium]
MGTAKSRAWTPPLSVNNSGFVAKTPRGQHQRFGAGGTYYVRWRRPRTEASARPVTVNVLSEAPIQTLTVNGYKIVADGKYNLDELPDKGQLRHPLQPP